MRPWGKGKSFAIAVTGGHTLLFGYLAASGDERFYRDFLMPVARYIVPDGERAHNFSVKACQFRMVPYWQSLSERLKIEVLGMKFKTPLGLAAGFDKNGEAIAGVYKMGFGFAEVGSVTPLPQPGNAKPRVFRLEEDKAIINRYGFNNHGHKVVFRNIKNAFFFRLGPLGVNLGANKNSTDVIDDYVQGVNAFQEVADFYVINVSSPNTAGLRSFQQDDKLQALLTAVLAERGKLKRRIPVLLKIAPDLSMEEKADIARLALETDLDGLVVCNTTVSRPDTLKSKFREETGGLSGVPETQLALQAVKDMYRLTKGRVPIIGCGGISNGQDAYYRLRAGASLVQIYTAFSYDGPPLIKRINREIEELLVKDGFSAVQDVIGIDSQKLDNIQPQVASAELPGRVHSSAALHAVIAR